MKVLQLFRGRERERDELLSAYLDGQLDKREREHLEARLADDPALQADLEALRQTVSLVRDLPAVPAPRNLILTPSMVEQPEPAPSRWSAPLLTAATAVASFLFVILLVGDLLLPGMGKMTSAPAKGQRGEQAPEMALEVPEGEDQSEAPTPEMMLEEAAPAPDEEAEEAPESGQEPGTPPALGGGGSMTETAPPAASILVTATEEAGAMPVTPVAEETASIVEAPSNELTVTPSVAIGEPQEPPTSPAWPRRVLEITLGLTALGLGIATVRAWRARR